ncbi:MAG: Rieske (2Fe-2S) protein [bacterium]|nr:Rieske (2Fe-2S) protein [bacterium]
MSEEEKKDINPESQGETTETPEDSEPKEPVDVFPEPGIARVNRRGFISKALVGVGAAFGLELGYAGFRLMATKPVGEKKPVQLSLSQLPEDSRMTVLYGGNKVEVIRDEAGRITALSMVCTHLGCLVIWKDEEKTYHCPCHDAYFDGAGNVVSGPPTQPLEEIPVTVSGNTVTIGG